MVGIVDYGMGNILSVKNAFEFIGAQVRICQSPYELMDVKRIILPGVGSFRDCVRNLTKKNFMQALNELVLSRKVPILGVCLGMQVMAKKGYEGGESEGLGWFDAEVIRITPSPSSLKVPHVGWNNLRIAQDSFLFNGLPSSFDVYFVHAYYMKCTVETNVRAYVEYGGEFTATVQKENIIATQFHPEKSQDYGLKMIENFMQWKP